ncbi:MAG: DUF3999 family protein [Acidobacteriota bacterium]
MPRLRRLALLACLSAGLAVWGGEPPYRYVREVRVEKAGWIRLRLPLEVLDRLSASGEDLALRGPDGASVPLLPWTGPAEPAPSVRKAAMVDVRADGGGWWVEADLGPGELRHRKVILEVPGTGLAENVTVEGSADGRSWMVLTRGSIFRLAPGADSAKTSLEYPPTRDRYLRLFWPREAGFPHWRRLWVEDWPDRIGEWAEDAVRLDAVTAPPGESRFRFDVPRVPLAGAALVLDMDLPFPVRARLLVGSEGEWRPLSEAALMPGRARVLGLPERALHPPAMLVLEAGGFALPVLRGAKLRYLPRYLLFHAPSPGSFTLLYGADAPGPSGLLGGLPEPPPGYASAEPGPERELPLPDLPAPTLALGAPLPAGPFDRSWAVEASGATGLHLVHLELPPQLYACARPDLADVRVASAGAQVPYVLWSPPGGHEVLDERDLRPAPTGEAGRSQILLDLPAERLPLTAMELSTAPVPFTRRVSLQVLLPADPEEGGRGEVWRDLDGAVWSCPGPGDLPARLRLRARPEPGKRLRLLFEDADNAPLQAVDVVLYARSDVLIFPWPGVGSVSLMAGCPRLGPPVYDLAAFRESMPRRPFAAARVAEAASPVSGGQTRADSFWRWSLLAALGLSVLVLLVVLSRSLGRRQDGGTP